MEMTKEEFEKRFMESLDALLVAMAENPDIDPKKFFNMACILENLSFFGPVIYGVIQKGKQ
jgi:hypothetical protein